MSSRRGLTAWGVVSALPPRGFATWAAFFGHSFGPRETAIPRRTFLSTSDQRESDVRTALRRAAQDWRSGPPGTRYRTLLRSLRRIPKDGPETTAAADVIEILCPTTNQTLKQTLQRLAPSDTLDSRPR